MHEEKEQVDKLNADIIQEKSTKASKKAHERQAAMKVIVENMNEKKKRQAELETIKRKDQVQIELNMRLALEKEQARE